MVRVGELFEAYLHEAPYGYSSGLRGLQCRVALSEFAMRPDETHEELLERPVTLRVVRMEAARRRFHAARIVPEIHDAAAQIAEHEVDDDGVFDAVIAAISAAHVAYRRGDEVAIGYRNALPDSMAPRAEGWRPGDVVPVWFDGEPTKRRAHLAFERPWRLALGTPLIGRILARNPYGVFVQVAPGFQALLHRSQWLPRADGRSLDELEIGEDISVCVCATDAERRRVAVSSFPPEVVARRASTDRLPAEGERASVTVLGVRDDGHVLVVFDDGAEGLIRPSDRWRIAHSLSPSSRLDVVVTAAATRGLVLVQPEMDAGAIDALRLRVVGAVERVRVVRHTTHNAFAVFPDGVPALVILHDVLPTWLDVHVATVASVGTDIDVTIRDVDHERGRVQVVAHVSECAASPADLLPVLLGQIVEATCLDEHDLGAVVRLDTGHLALIPLCGRNRVECGSGVRIQIQGVDAESGMFEASARPELAEGKNVSDLTGEPPRAPSAPTQSAQRSLGRKLVDLIGLFGTNDLSPDDWPHAYCMAIQNRQPLQLDVAAQGRVRVALTQAEALGVRTPHTLSSAARVDAATVGALVSQAFERPFPAWRHLLSDSDRSRMLSALNVPVTVDTDSSDSHSSP